MSEFKEIPLTRGKKAVVDPDTYDWLSGQKWYASLSTKGVWTAVRNPAMIDGVRKGMIIMHRAIMNLNYGDKRQVDHINGNTLDNRRCNLRIATSSQNCCNKGPYKQNITRLKGITKATGSTPGWVASIKLDRRAIRLGRFRTPEEAHLAYRYAAKHYHGEFARCSWKEQI